MRFFVVGLIIGLAILFLSERGLLQNIENAIGPSAGGGAAPGAGGGGGGPVAASGCPCEGCGNNTAVAPNAFDLTQSPVSAPNPYASGWQVNPYPTTANGAGNTNPFDSVQRFF